MRFFPGFRARRNQDGRSRRIVQPFPVFWIGQKREISLFCLVDRPDMLNQDIPIPDNRATHKGGNILDRLFHDGTPSE